MGQGLEQTLAVPNKMSLPLSPLSFACVENGKCVHWFCADPEDLTLHTLSFGYFCLPGSLLSSFSLFPVALQRACPSLALSLLLSGLGTYPSSSPANPRSLGLRGTVVCWVAAVGQPKTGPAIGCRGQSTAVVI